MKTHNVTEIVALCTVMLIVTLAGCLSNDQTDELRDAAHTAILEYVETRGQEAAVEYIDQLVADGKLGAANAEKIKEAIPLGIDKLREVMGELEAEETQEEQEEAQETQVG